MVLLSCRTLTGFQSKFAIFFFPLTYISFSPPSNWLCHPAGPFIKELNTSLTHLSTHMTVTLLKNVLISSSLAQATLHTGTFAYSFRSIHLAFHRVFVIDSSELKSLYLQKVYYFRGRTCVVYFFYIQFLSVNENRDSLLKCLLDWIELN